MAKKFDLIVFDWDGTILDSTGAIVHAIQAACLDLGLPAPSADTARHVIGLGLADALRYAAPQLSESEVPQIVARYRHHYLAQDHGLCLFDGIAALIDQLHAAGYQLAVATGKGRSGLDRALLHSGLGRYFVSSRCADECFSKPHPQMLEELMVELGCVPERTVMIGDTAHDLLMARNAGVPALAVTYGAHPESSLRELNPLQCLGDVEALAGWLRMHA